MERMIIIPQKSAMWLDIMIGGYFYTQIKMKVTAGMEYGYSELVTYARMKLPSLARKSFQIIPTDNPKPK